MDSGGAEPVGDWENNWFERTPQGVRFRVAMAERGQSYGPMRGDGSLVGDLMDLIARLVWYSARQDGTWKVAVLHKKTLRPPRRVHEQTGMSQDEAEREVERLLSCVRRGDLFWETSSR